jgi:MraZ protein
LDGFFIGEFAHAVDEKGRLAIPSKFRPRFKEGAVVTRWLERSLAVFPATRFAELQERVAKLPLSDRNARQFIRFLASGAHDDEPDAQGRIAVPQHLRDYAGIANEAIVVGANDHLEIWSPKSWREYIADTEGSMAERLQDLGI